MLGRLAILVLFLVMLLGATALHYGMSREDDGLQRLSALTMVVAPSLSVAFYEPRLLYTDDESHPAYPSMTTMNRRSFIYAN